MKHRSATDPASTRAAPLRRATGAAAEDLASEFLQARGLTVVERNFRCTRGEIDLIMRHNGELVFVEVRARSNSCFGDGAESVNSRKQGRLQRTAATFLQRNTTWASWPCRFDVVSVALRHGAPRIEWIPDAFQL